MSFRRERENGGVPDRWLPCPRKSECFISDKFLIFKTPLGSEYNDYVPIQNRFPPKMIFDYMQSKKARLGLWIDLTNTSRFYSKTDIENNGAIYTKLSCRGHAETPSKEQIRTFVETCSNFTSQNSSDYIGIHCTHGFNRSGFLVCCFLIQEYDFSVQAALALFAKCRPPGIYKQDYINVLWDMYKEDTDTPPPQAPALPQWCYNGEPRDESPGMSTMGKRTYEQSNGDHSNRNTNGAEDYPAGSDKRHKRRKGETFIQNPTFMEGISGVEAITDRAEVAKIQQKVQRMCGWRGIGFPGSQPVSMDVRNIDKLSSKPYMVSWKADGTRYLMLIEGRGQVYFVDRDNSVFIAHDITFPCKKDLSDHLVNTLVDGEMVVDNVNGLQIPRYLIYDVIQFRGNETGQCDFRLRLTCIRDEIVNPRYEAIKIGLIDRIAEPFGVRFKTFWFVEDTEKILEGTFAQELLHEPDGLIFQPVKHPYTCGRCDEVLKWKPPELNTIDFRLKVVTETGEGILPGKVGELYVNQLNTPFSYIRPCQKSVQKYDGKIIECKFDNERGWVFLRERVDKSFPNALNTANSVVFSIKNPVNKNYLLEFIAIRRFRKDGVI